MSLPYLPRVLCSASLLLLVLSSCERQHDTTPPPQLATAVQETLSDTLTAPGWLQPIQVTPIISPIDGRLVAIHHPIGETVENNALLYSLTGDDMDKKFYETLTNYLISKENKKLSAHKLAGKKALFAAGLNSKNDYLNQKLDDDNQTLNTLKNKRALMELCHTYHVSFSALERQTIQTIIQNASYQTIKAVVLTLSAPQAGKLLPATFNVTKDATAKIPYKNIKVEKGDILATIADTHHLAAQLSIPEYDITKIKLGQQATITSDAFPNITLHGQVSKINLANITPPDQRHPVHYPVTVTIDPLTDRQQQQVLIGMSLNVSIHTGQHTAIFIPLDAVNYDNHQYWVTVKHHGTYHKKPVTPGFAALDKVAILHGLRAGEQVAIS